jgi:hypothetical protein
MFTWGLVLSNLALAIGKFLLKKKIQKSVFILYQINLVNSSVLEKKYSPKTHDFIRNAYIKALNQFLALLAMIFSAMLFGTSS